MTDDMMIERVVTFIELYLGMRDEETYDCAERMLNVPTSPEIVCMNEDEFLDEIDDGTIPFISNGDLAVFNLNFFDDCGCVEDFPYDLVEVM